MGYLVKAGMKMNLKKIWKIIFFLTLMLPFSEGYSILNGLSLSYGITILDVAFLIYILIAVIVYGLPRKIKKGKIFGYLLIFLLIITTIYILVQSYKVYGMSAFRDSFNYLMCFFFLVGVFFLKDLSINEIMEITKKSYIGYTIITIICYFLFLSQGERIGSNCFTLSIAVIPYAVKEVFERGKNKRQNIFLFFCFMANIVLSQNRTNAVLTVIVSFYVAVSVAKQKLTKKMFNRLAFLLAFFLVGLLIFYVSQTAFVERLLTGGGIDTMGGRMQTFIYYWSKFKENLNGYGFGYVMHFVNEIGYVLPSETYQIDNAFIVYAIKGGVIYLLVNMLLVCMPFVKRFYYGTEERKFWSVTYFALLVGASIMTSQLIQGRAIGMFIWTIIGMAIQNSNCTNVRRN